jgi:hypothetical protein
MRYSVISSVLLHWFIVMKADSVTHTTVLRFMFTHKLLQVNTHYDEKEDEFDTVVTATSSTSDAPLPNGFSASATTTAATSTTLEPDTESIDVLTVARVPAFASDSEDELQAFALAAVPGGQQQTTSEQAGLTYDCCQQR